MNREMRADYETYVGARAPTMLRLAYLIEGERAAAEDLLQTAFVKLYQAWPRIDRDLGPDAYLRRIIMTTHASRWRRKAVHEVPLADPPEPARQQAAPDSAVADRHLLWAALGRLPRMQRAVVILRWYEDLTEADVARVLDVSVGTVKQHNHRALRALRLDPELTAMEQ
jgi:RNA polymerase sigma-70 factor (sigma-E family)